MVTIDVEVVDINMADKGAAGLLVLSITSALDCCRMIVVFMMDTTPGVQHPGVHWSVADDLPEAALEIRKDFNEFGASSIVRWWLVTLTLYKGLLTT